MVMCVCACVGALQCVGVRDHVVSDVRGNYKGSLCERQESMCVFVRESTLTFWFVDVVCEGILPKT